MAPTNQQSLKKKKKDSLQNSSVIQMTNKYLENTEV